MLALAIAGVAADVVSRLLVAARRASEWTAAGLVYGVFGLAGLALVAAGDLPLIDDAWWVLAAFWLAVVLFAGTRAFVALTAGWPLMARAVARTYGYRGRLGVWVTLAASCAIGAGEELFWRGIVPTAVEASAAAVIAWAGYVAVNILGRNAALIAGALVAGGVWAWLAVASGGVLAPVVCHAVWTALMVLFPPRSVLPAATAS